MTDTTFPPAEAKDKAKYRQFLIDHGFDPNLNHEDLKRQFEAMSEAEREQVDAHWREFVAAS